MSQENVEIVRRAHEAWQRDDFESFLSLIDSAVEWLTATERGVGGVTSVYRGHEGMRELWNLWRSEFEDFWIDIEEIRDLGDERVLALAHGRFRGSASGITVESQLALVQTIRSGKIVRSMDYLSHQEALEAVGLSE
jgi:ketosteroid isomerase-like protein